MKDMVSLPGFLTFAAYFFILKALIVIIISNAPESAIGRALAALS